MLYNQIELITSECLDARYKKIDKKKKEKR